MSCYIKGLAHSKYSLYISHCSDSNSSTVPPCCSPYISSLFSLSSSGTHLPFPWHIDVLSHPPAHSWLRGTTCLSCLCSLLAWRPSAKCPPPCSVSIIHVLENMNDGDRAGGGWPLSTGSPCISKFSPMHFQVHSLCSVQHCPNLLCSEVLG